MHLSDDDFLCLPERWQFLLPALALLVLASSSLAQTPEPLSLDQAVLRALQTRFTVRVAEVAVEQARAGVTVAGEPFEATASGSAEFFREPSLLPGEAPGKLTGNRTALEVGKVLPTGTEVAIGLETSQISGYDPSDQAQVFLGITQPLLRNAGTAVNRAAIRIADRVLDRSRESLRQAVMDTLTEVQFAYFDAYLAENNVQVAEESLRLSQRLLEENQRRADIGSIARSDLLQAEAEVAAREEQLYSAQVGLVQAVNDLKQLLTNETRGLLDWTLALQALPAPQPRTADPRGDFARALQKRPDYRDATLALDINQIEQLRSRNQKLPNLDLYARMNWYGVDDSASGSLANVSDDRRPAYVAGIRLSRSFSNRAAEARSTIDRLQQRRLEWGLRELEQAILLDLDVAATRMERFWKRLESARRGRLLAEQSLTAEEQRYQTGTSSTFVLIRLQTDLTNARIRELVAANEYRKAVLLYDRLTADLLDAHAIEL